MDLEGIMLSKINQMGKDKYHMISLMWNIINKINKQAKPNKNQQIVLQNRVVLSTRGEEVGSEGEVDKGGQTYGNRWKPNFG